MEHLKNKNKQTEMKLKDHKTTVNIMRTSNKNNRKKCAASTGATGATHSPDSDFLAYFLLCPRMMRMKTSSRMKMSPTRATTTRNHHSS